MRVFPRIAATLFMVTMVGLLAGPGPAGAATRRALLVGVAEYPYLVRKSLIGPTNDVELMRGLLVERFDFEPENVTVLSGGLEKENAPTRANITRAFERLAQAAQAGDEVVILLAGHGSQLPADDDPDDIELDGADETFLPLDVRGWPEGRAEESIRDDKIREWLLAIQKTGAFTWLIADTCSSGTLARGAGERSRQVPAHELLPPEVWAEAEGRGESVRGATGREADVSGVPTDAPNVVALYAARPDELTLERGLPDKFKDDSHGIFTYTIYRLLDQARAPMTYRELKHRITAHYQATQMEWTNPLPTPLIEGGGADREIFGLREWPARPSILLSRAPDGELRVDAGDLQGLLPGSILAVYPPAGDHRAREVVGHLKVVATSAVESTVEPVAWAGLPAAGSLPDHSRCSVVSVDYGDARIRLAVQSQVATGDGGWAVQTFGPGAGPEALEAKLRGMDPNRALTERIEDPAEADMLLRSINGWLYLIPASEWAGDPEELPARLRLGRLDDPKTLASLESNLGKAAKVGYLLKVARGGAAAGGGGGDPAIGVDLWVDGDPIQPGTELEEGTRFEIEVRNESTESAVHHGVLYVDAHFGITQLMPNTVYKCETDRLSQGKSVRCPFEIGGKMYGWEQIVTLAVPAADPESEDFKAGAPDFSVWVQSAVTTREGTRGAPPPAADPQETMDEQLRTYSAVLFPLRTRKKETSTGEQP